MIITVYIAVIAALLLFPDVCAQSARDALSVWGLHVMPSLFPYMVFSKLLAEKMKKMRFPPAGACAMLGAIGGSPSGASLIASLKYNLSPKAVLSLCAFTGTVSPMFFLGTVRTWCADTQLPQQLFVSQLAGAMLTACCVCFILPKTFSFESSDIPAGMQEKTPLAQSIDAILQIGGCIICFSVLASLLNMLPLPKAMLPVIHAILEISGGVHALVHTAMHPERQRILLAAVSGFGGMSILSQNLLFLRPAGIRANWLLILSLIRALFSALVISILISL